ncbi:MAG: TolC family protein [Parvularcula sp.]
MVKSQQNRRVRTLLGVAMGTAVLFGGVPAGLAAKPVAFAESASPSTFLIDVTEEAQRTPRYGAIRARLDATRQAVRTARAAGLPDIAIQGSAAVSSGSYDPGAVGGQLISGLVQGQNMAGQSALGDFGSTNTRQGALSITQPVFTGFRIKNGIEQAKAVVASAEAEFDASYQALIVDLADAYLAVATAEGRRESAATSVESLSRQVRAAKLSFEAGQATRTDVSLAEAQLAAAQARHAASIAAVTAARGAYAALTGHEAVPSDGPIVPLALPPNAEAVVTRALENHPALVQAAAARRASDAAARVAKGARAPSVQLRGSVSYSENRFFPEDEATNASLTAELSVPVFKGGEVSADVARTKAEARASRFNEVDIRRQIESQARSAYAGWVAADLSLEAARARLAASELAFRGAALEQEVGQRSILDVLRVEEDLQAARAGLLDAEREAVIASFRVRQAMGDLSP